MNYVNLIATNCYEYKYLHTGDNSITCNEFTYSHCENCPLCLLGYMSVYIWTYIQYFLHNMYAIKI